MPPADHRESIGDDRNREHSRSERVQFQTLLRAPGAPWLVLRAFLGVTFTFAGLQKLANPDFFRASSPTSFQSQLAGAMHSSPIRGLLHLVNHFPVALAVVIACAEVAVGVGTTLGLFGRLAATGGLLLSLSFFLTISYTTSPYYYGSDIVFVFAWTTIVIGGSGALSIDARLARRAEAMRAGAYDATMRATLERRVALYRLGVLAAAGVFSGALIGVVTGIGRAANHRAESPGGIDTIPETTNTTAGTTTTEGSSGSGARIAATASIAVGGAFGFIDTAQQIPAYVVHPDASTFVAFSAVCTHAGCTVGYNPATIEFDCPCHGSIYDAKTGAVVRGPATQPLASIAITERDGEIYSTG